MKAVSAKSAGVQAVQLLGFENRPGQQSDQLFAGGSCLLGARGGVRPRRHKTSGALHGSTVGLPATSMRRANSAASALSFTWWAYTWFAAQSQRAPRPEPYQGLIDSRRQSAKLRACSMRWSATPGVVAASAVKQAERQCRSISLEARLQGDTRALDTGFAMRLRCTG